MRCGNPMGSAFLRSKTTLANSKRDEEKTGPAPEFLRSSSAKQVGIRADLLGRAFRSHRMHLTGAYLTGPPHVCRRYTGCAVTEDHCFKRGLIRSTRDDEVCRGVSDRVRRDAATESLFGHPR